MTPQQQEQYNKLIAAGAPASVALQAVQQIPATQQTQTTQTTPTPATATPPTGQLMPGSTGDAVKQLQNYLVSKGLMTQQQVATGYGTYGPQTTAAVAKLQQQLGVDNASGVGYYGPKTIAAIGGSSTSQSQGGNTQTGDNAGSTTTTDINTYNPSYGVTPEQWAQMNGTQRAVISAASTAKQAAYQSDGQQLTFADALKAAAADPNIISTYADAAKLDAQDFQQNLQQLQTASSTAGELNQMQFENDRKQLAEQSAAKGQAYSGFRNQAQEQLGKTEAGIVQSSRSALKQSLDSATRAFEAKYGTAATTPATANFSDPLANSNISLSGQYQPKTPTTTILTGQLAGGIAGTQGVAQNSAINTKATQLYDVANAVPTIN